MLDVFFTYATHTLQAKEEPYRKTNTTVIIAKAPTHERSSFTNIYLRRERERERDVEKARVELLFDRCPLNRI